MRFVGDLITSGIILLTGCVLFYYASLFPHSRRGDQVGPALWPKMILSLIIILSTVLLIQQVVRLIKTKGQQKEQQTPLEKEGSRMLLLSIMLSLFYGFGVSYAGFLLSIFLFQILFLLILKVKKMHILVLYPICLTGVIYAIFIKVLYIPLPRGTGIFLTISRFFY